MIKNRKLRSVVRHEFLTIIRQPSFWISLIALPLLIGVIILIGVLTSPSEDTDLENIDDLQIAIVDKSGLISREVVGSYQLNLEEGNVHELSESVRSGELDGLIVYPEDVSTTGVYEMFADNTERRNGGIVSELGRTMLQQSLLTPIESEELAMLALTGGQGTLQTYTDGEPERSFEEIIVPGAFLVLFYIVLVFSVGYALTSVSEEKENRSIEMVLSYVKPQTLILGKLLAIILVTLTQIVFFALLALAIYVLVRSLGNSLSLPFGISDLTFVPQEIVIGIGFLIFGFVFFVGLMAMIGAIFPSSKEANSFSTVFYFMPAVPFWGFEAITTQPSSVFTQVLTYIPLTSPTTVLLRNASGNIGLGEALVSLLLLIIATAVIVVLAAKAFRLGTLEYTNRIAITSLLRK